MNIYVDSTNGINKDNSDCYKTLDFALEYCTKLSDKTIDVILGKGKYELSLHNSLFCSNKTVTIIGMKAETVLTQVQGFYSNSGGGSALFTMNICKLIYNTSAIISSNWNFFSFNWSFYNVVFDIIASESYSLFFPSSSLSINNCIKLNSSSSFLRGLNIKVKNSYGCFTNGYSTVQANWDYGNNIIITVTKIDKNYKLLIDNKTCGLYSGLYAWSLDEYFLKQNDKIYSIKSEFYDTITKNFKPVTLTGGVSPNKIDYETYGFDDLNLLAQNMTVGTDVFRPIDKFNGLIELYKYVEI